MNTRAGRWMVAVTVAALTLMAAASPSAAAVDKCAKFVNAESLKMQSTAFKAFQKCHDAYWKDVLKPPAPAFSKAAKACQKELGKLIGAEGSLATSIAKLAARVPKTCMDADLVALGHMPPFLLGTHWAEFQAVAALQLAYEQMLGAMRSWVGILETVGDTGSCASCVALTRPPCLEMSCRLTNSNALFQLVEGVTVQIPLQGALVLKVCDASQVLADTAGVRFVIASPGRVFLPAAGGSLGTLCVTTLGGEGVIDCATTARKISDVHCIDHDTGGETNVAGALMSGDCQADICEASATDTVDPKIVNGGTCADFTTAAGSPGDAMIALTFLMAGHAQGSVCTDTPSAPGAIRLPETPRTIVFTTATATAMIKHANHTAAEILGDTYTGAPFSCTLLKAGRSPGVKLVGTFSGLDFVELIPGVIADSVTGFALQCE